MCTAWTDVFGRVKQVAVRDSYLSCLGLNLNVVLPRDCMCTTLCFGRVLQLGSIVGGSCQR